MKKNIPIEENIRQRAKEIWQRKCKDLNTELDDWLQAERELSQHIGIEGKKPEEYTVEQKTKISERAEKVREEKINSLHTAFDDWIEAEQELKKELESKVNVLDLFDRWFSKASAGVIEALKTGEETSESDIYDIMGKHYIQMMSDIMK